MQIDPAFGILYEDDHLLVIDKPAGLALAPTCELIHPGHPLFRIGGELQPGVVVGLDRDTSEAERAGWSIRDARSLRWRSAPERDRVLDAMLVQHEFVRTFGVYVAGKNDDVRASLAAQFRERRFLRRFPTVIAPPPRIDSIAVDAGSPWAWEWRIVERFGDLAVLVECVPVGEHAAGLRQYFADVGSPVLGDRLHAGRRPRDRRLWEIGRLLAGQALRSRVLSFAHPATGDLLTCVSEPSRMPEALAMLRAATATATGR